MNWKALPTSRPYHWPLSGQWSAQDTALIVIDMQQDFLSSEGYFAQMGYELEQTRAAIEPTRQLLAGAREQNMLVIYTCESHRPDLKDLHPTKRARAEAMGAPIGAVGPLGRFLVRGEAGCDIVEELKPNPGDVLIDKPGNGAFHATDLDQVLRAQGIQHLLLCGVTTDVCVHSTLREANDLGYDCLLVEDCCGAGSVDLHEAALAMMMNEGGIFGAIAKQDELNSHWRELDHENRRAMV